MKTEKYSTGYWFIIEPFVFIGYTNKCVLLYNTIDGVVLKSKKIEVIQLIKEILQESNCGVVFLENDRYNLKNIYDFIRELREKYMGDIIDVSLSNSKPVQLLPYCNYLDKQEVYKKLSFSTDVNLLKNLFEITVYVNVNTHFSPIISFLKSIESKTIVNVVWDVIDFDICDELMSFFEQKYSEKYIICSYEDVIQLYFIFKNSVSYKVSVCFSADRQKIYDSMRMLINCNVSFECVFYVSSEKEYEEAEELVDHFELNKYRFDPVYTGDNIHFFEDYVFLTEEDILSTSMTIKDFFMHKSINIYDFGKINIMSNGDVYANLNYPILGNIYIDNIYEIIQKEVDDGKSWFRIRNQSPCNDCIYQWLCPSPSNNEIAIGRPNLCYVKP